MEKNIWKIKKIPIKDLILWDDNPRTFDKNHPNPAEKEIISRYDTEKLLKIAKNIIKYQRVNLQPGEMTVIEKNRKFVVYDGNRRISAYKILFNNDLISEQKTRFEELTKKVLFDENKKLLFNVAPNIQSALDRVEELHTNNFHENWNAIAKSNFATINIDSTIKDLKEKKDHIKRTNLYNKIKSFEYSPKIDKIIKDSEKFNITSLERIVDSSIGKKHLNYDFNEKGEIIINGKENEFNALLKRVSEDVAMGAADSREQRLNKDKENYFNKIKQELFEQKLISGKPLSKKEVGTLLDKDWITDKLYRRYNGANRVKRLLKEMKDVTPKNYENISVVTLRVLLELSLYYFLEKSGNIEKIIKIEKEKIRKENEKRARSGKPLRDKLQTGWTPKFKQMLDYIAQENDAIIDPMKRNTVNRLLKNKEYRIFIDELNSFIHDVNYIPDKDEVVKLWKKFGIIIFEIVM